ncbi:unnamed protein product [Symbiodinium natans]|uniref:CSD domain-containing protein n=1 Tax=Symbiodinium natans TaxID=878477 RepID=A0A812LYH9_9DINO|nr:unnamed protein product [Symbiodinium natans]
MEPRSGRHAVVEPAGPEVSVATGNLDLPQFEPRDVGSAEQLMLSRMPEGHMITTHSSMALLEGKVDAEKLKEALFWAILRHPMLRAAAREPTVLAKDTGPFFHGGQDGRWRWEPTSLTKEEIVQRALVVEEVSGDFDAKCKERFEASLDKTTFDLENGPLWKLRLLRQAGFRGPRGGRSTLLFSFVHSVDDQKSANILLHELLTHMESAEKGERIEDPTPAALPASLEDVFLQDELDVQKLAGYALSQATAGAKPFMQLPSALRAAERNVRKNFVLNPAQPIAKERNLTVPTASAEGNAKLLMAEAVSPQSGFWSESRQNLVAFRHLPAQQLSQLRQLCRENNVTVSMAVAVAALLAASDISNDDMDFAYEAYRMLLGVDMRRFAPGGDWTQGTMAYASGALDFMLRLLPKSGQAYSAEHENASIRSKIGGVPFWDLARASAFAVREWAEKGYAAESTRLFDIGIRLLRMDNIIRETANDPNTLGRAYSVTVSNAGVYGQGPDDGRYGSLRLDKIYFGISTAISGSFMSASCLTVNGDLLVTAHSAAPVANRSELDSFADSMIRSLAVAAMEPVPRASMGTPPVDNPIDPRGGLPWYYLLETPKGTLQCPKYEDVRSPTLPAFNVDKYVGVWYELAFHDITQCNGCGCTRFNMTRHGNVIEDMFTVTCPWPWKKGVDGPWLPGYNANGNRRMNMWTCNMTMYYKPAEPGVMLETGFGQEFDNMVLEIWSDPEITAETGYEYTRAIQFQCLGSEQDGITFTGINFLSRVPIVKPSMFQEMFNRARALGLEPYGSNDMHVVEHAPWLHIELGHLQQGADIRRAPMRRGWENALSGLFLYLQGISALRSEQDCSAQPLRRSHFGREGFVQLRLPANVADILLNLFAACALQVQVIERLCLAFAILPASATLVLQGFGLRGSLGRETKPTAWSRAGEGLGHCERSVEHFKGRRPLERPPPAIILQGILGTEGGRAKLEGEIKSFYAERGFGFISCQKVFEMMRCDVFFTLNEVFDVEASQVEEKVRKGVKCSFFFTLNKDSRPQARVVRLEKGTADDDRPAHQSSKFDKTEAEDEKYTGRIKSFNPAKGYGFISCDETFARFNRDVFLHHSQLNGFKAGDEVNFRIFVDRTKADAQAKALDVQARGMMAGGFAGIMSWTCVSQRFTAILKKQCLRQNF